MPVHKLIVTIELDDHDFVTPSDLVDEVSEALRNGGFEYNKVEHIDVRPTV